jgi:hypothetical protein
MGTNITGIGNANAIGFKSRVTGGTYFPPELKDALVGVWSAYGKSNDSTDRNIIKNKIKDRGGDFVISNAAFKLNSGFGKYETELSNTRIWTQSKETTSSPFSSNYNGLSGWIVFANTELTNSVDMPSFKIQVKGLLEGQELIYRYYDSTGQTNVYSMTKDGKYTLPADVRTAKPLTSNTSGFQIVKNETNTITITQIPSFEGAFVTDGIDDLITSTKTVQEMGITDEITVVSMIHKISSDNNWTNLIGELKEDHTFVANRATNTDKTGIYGYTYNYVGDAIVINNILGDKNDYIVRTSTSLGLDNKYYVTGFRSAGIIQNISQIAWYWTFIANRVLTEDEINLVIEKYNLDRPGEIVKPQVYYNIKKQKISNDNHSAFDDKLIDYSGNGYDAKLYNFGWKEDSGIGKYETDFTDWKKSFKVTSFDSESIKFTSDVSWVLLYHPSSIGEDIPSFKVRIKLYGKGTLYYNYITQEGKYTNVAVKSEIFETPICYNTKYTGEKGVNVGFTLGVTSGECSGTITQIPEYENALVLDGVDDYGKVTGLPILKDYTVAADYIRTFAKESAQDSPILSKSKVAGSGAFLFNYLNADSITSSYSFGTNNILKEINDSERKIYYLSKYASDGHNVNAGSAVDYDTMWLGTYRDNISNFFTGALYFAMLFPYSLSEFLLERQIKKARAGTLYSNQVEFRPIIPEDENITRIDYFVVDSGIWKVIKPGDYVDVGARIVLNVYTKLPYKIEKVSSLAFTGMSVGPSTKLNIFDVKGYIKDKTPQKIKLTLAVNEDIVQWNPAITSNLLDSFTVSSWYLNGWDNTLTAGTWIKKTDRVFFKATFKTELYGLETATFGGTECVVSKANNWSDSKNIWDIRMLGTVGDLSQIFNLDVYELIRFEDIVQPYPALLRFKDENGNEVSWGGKFKVGSTITRIGSAADSNLLPNIYNIFGLLLNGNQVTSSKVIVEKTMVFKVKSAYIFDNNEPKCILSPRLLRIPNSSYKILGHIPDISGHGNNGKINNSAYEGMSGVNGYPVVFGKNKTWANESNGYVTNITSNTIHITNVLNTGLALLYSYVKYNGNLQNIKEIPPFKIEIKGLEGRSKFIYKYLATSNATKETNLYLGNGTHELPKSFLPTEALINNAVVGFSISPIEEGVTNFLSDITIKVLPEYEGAYCLDGVDDFVTIPTATGGKQVFMKVNSRKSDCYLYDQRNNWTQYLGIVSTKDFIAYNYSNQRGKTYIDGILNENITANDLIDITHNITVTNNRDDVKQYSPCIGTSFARNSFAQMALYDFMLFDNISTDDKIKELNEYIGLSGNIFEFNPPTFTIDLPMAIKNIKVYQGGNEISPGYLYPNKDTEFEVYVSLNDGKYAVDTITVDGVEITKDRVVGEYNIFKFILNGSSEQKIKIHSYEYIMYEDINQPYPVIFKVKDRTTNQIYSWGDRIKIGSSIQLIHGENPNLLPELYSIISYTYEGNSYSYNQLTNLVITVTKTISVSCQKTWKLGSNEPKCILSPKRLKLANSSYKYLGYIPDISGNGNNGVFNNFAFSGMSGANGYTYEYTNTSDFSVLSKYARTINSEKIEFFGYTNAVTFYRKNPTYKGKIKIEGLTSAISSGKVQHFQIYTNSKTNTETSVFKTDGVYDIDVTGIGDATNVYFYVLPANTSESGTLDNPITIEQVGNYEGAICFDGIDDYVTIPTLSKGGKQVLMKVNWNTINSIIYDQRGSGGFAIYCSDYNNPSDSITVPAYKGRNAAGTTYIDGIRNEYIIASQLRNVTHNIVEILDTSYAAGNINPIIGKSYLNANYGKMSLYDFVLFDEVSTDEEIKQLNDIIGIEGDYVQKPDYYWDAYGKTNSDADRDTIQQRGIAVGDYDLTNTNFAYDKMSGFGGYTLGKFTNSWSLSNNSNSISIVARNPYDITLKKLGGNSDWEFNTTELKLTSNPVSVKFKSDKNIRFTCDYHYYTVGGNSEGAPLGITSKDLIANEDTIITISPISQENIDKYNIDINRGYYLIYFQLSPTLAVNEEVTIEMLPLYPNGLVYDGVDDYSENTSIPAFTDYTYIFKRTILNIPSNGATLLKGSHKTNGGAFIADYGNKWQFNFGQYNTIQSIPDGINWQTSSSFNGTSINRGTNTDDEGITVSRFSNGYTQMVFYKLMLYPRTTDMLTINMIKNMMAEDGIIDIQGKLFTDKFTGDFNLDFNKDFLIGN